MEFDMRYIENASEVEITITTKSSYWFGISFGSGMTLGNDMIMCTTDGFPPTCYDMTSTGFAAPEIDSSQDLTTRVEMDSDFEFIYYTIRRQLDTSDSDDFVVPLDKEFEMAWAAGVDTNDVTV